MRGYDYLVLLQSSGLHIWLLACLNSGATPDVELLAGVAALGTLCTEGTAQLLVDAGVVPVLHRLTVQRGEEDAFALATTLAAHRLLRAGPSRDALLQRPELVARFTELLEHQSKEVSCAADAALDCVAALSEEWAASVRRLRFEAHNRLWIDVIGGAPSVVVTANESVVGESSWVAPPSLLVLEGGEQES